MGAIKLGLILTKSAHDHSFDAAGVGIDSRGVLDALERLRRRLEREETG